MTFGPQNANAALTLPKGVTRNRYGERIPTYVKDASAPGLNDGTVLDAAFFNRLIMALDYIAEQTATDGDTGDHTILWRAIRKSFSVGAPVGFETLADVANALGNNPNLATDLYVAISKMVRADIIQAFTVGQLQQIYQNLQLSLVARTGAFADLTGASGVALLDSPAFIGNPSAPTKTTTDNTVAIATTAFAQALLASFKASAGFTGPVSLAADPSSPLHAATKQYVDGLAANVGKRARVRVATVGNVAISTALNAGQVIDGVTLATGDWVLVKNQTDATQNGVYVAGSTPVRAPEFDTWGEHPGSLLVIAEGATSTPPQADTIWLCTSNEGGTLGSTAIAFSKFSFTPETTTSIGSLITGSTEKTVLVDADRFAVSDSASSGILSRFTWANLKAQLKAYFDTLYSGFQRNVNRQTGTSYTLAVTDIGGIVDMNNAAANTVTFPPNSVIPIPVNTQIEISQRGAGKTTCAPGAGVTIVNSSRSVAGQFSALTAIKEATDTWVLYGTSIA